MRWPENGSGPSRTLQGRVGDEQILRPQERRQACPASRAKGDVRYGDDDRHDKELDEAESASANAAGMLSSAAHRAWSTVTITGCLRRNSTHGPSGTATAVELTASPVLGRCCADTPAAQGIQIPEGDTPKLLRSG